MKCAEITPLLLTPLLLVSSAMSQLDDWENVKMLLGGTKIKVQLKQGRTFGHCFVTATPDDALVCSIRGGPFGIWSRRMVYPRDNVKAVYLAHNGTLIGMGVGAAAGAVIGAATSDALLEMEQWRNRWTVSEWREYLAAGESEADLATLRQCTHTGRPLGSLEFIEALEKSIHRHLAPQKGGRPEKSIADGRQHTLPFHR